MPAAVADTRPRRTQTERRQESERGLLQAAASLIAEAGVNAATFEAVGARAGYSRGLATQKFGSKQGMIEALVAYLRRHSDELIEISSVDALPGLDAVVFYVDSYMTHLKDNPELRAYFVLLSGAVADHSGAGSVFADTHRWFERRMEDVIRRGQRDGSIRRAIDANSAALMIGSLLLGVSTQTQIDPAMSLDPIRKTIRATITAAFAAS